MVITKFKHVSVTFLEGLNFIMLPVGFQQLRIKQELLYKCHEYKGFWKWFTDWQIIASVSEDEVIEDKQCYRCMRLHK